MSEESTARPSLGEKLTKPTQVGNTIIEAGCLVSTLVGRAEREYEYQHTPEAIAERQKRLRQFVNAAAGAAHLPPGAGTFDGEAHGLFAALSPRVAPSQAVECDYTGGWCVRNVCQESKNCQAISEFVPLVNAAARSHIAPFCLEPREVEALLDWHHMMTDAACQSDQFNAEAEHRTRYRAIEKMRTLAVSTPAPSANGDPRPYGAGFPPSSTEPTWDQLDAIVREHDLKTRSLMDTAELIWRLSAIGEKTDG